MLIAFKGLNSKAVKKLHFFAASINHKKLGIAHERVTNDEDIQYTLMDPSKNKSNVCHFTHASDKSLCIMRIYDYKVTKHNDFEITSFVYMQYDITYKTMLTSTVLMIKSKNSTQTQLEKINTKST